MFRTMIALALFTMTLHAGLRGEDIGASRGFGHVSIQPAKTSIYVGSVSLTMPTFVRKAGVYESTYAAKVFPYFFSNEAGKLVIAVSDEQLQALANGEAIDFIGRGVRDDGAERQVEGKATPTDHKSGKIKVRVFVSKRIELIFNTTYRFDGS